MISIRTGTALVVLAAGLAGFFFPNPAYTASCDAVVGKWAWFVGGEVTINADGTFTQQSGNAGTWECLDAAKGAVALKWKHGGYLNRLALADGGTKLVSTDPSQSFVKATRINQEGALADLLTRQDTNSSPPSSRRPTGQPGGTGPIEPSIPLTGSQKKGPAPFDSPRGIVSSDPKVTESFLDTECLHKAPAGIALQGHIAEAKSGDAQSMFCAGAIKLYVSKEYHNAIPWLEQAANAGHMRAPLVLGILYEQGSGVKEDPATAAKWYQKGIDNGNAAAARRLANLYHLGTGVPHDEAKSTELLKKAVEMGDRAAPKFIEKREQDLKDTRPGMNIKAEAYRSYKQKRFEQAAKLYQQCAEMGNDDCQLAMGQLTEFGDGVPKNEKQAAFWYKKSADQGNPIGQKTLGLLYELGKGVPENWAEAFRLYFKGAEKFQDSAFAVGRMYEFGMAVPQNRAIAIEWFKKADKLGHPKGAYWAKWLNDYSNCIGFRDQQERNAIGGLRCPADPVGVIFHNSGERTAYIRRMAKEFDRIEAEQAMAQAALSSQTTDTGCTMAGGRWTPDRQATFGGSCN